MDRPDWVSSEVDVERPSPARVYDYLLGGGSNFAPDRELGEQLLAVIPEIRQWALNNRAFLRRAVQFLADAGIRQFLDLGSGIPTVGNVHEIALRAAPDARVAYIDIDPVAVAHSRVMVAGNPQVVVVQTDIRKPWDILDDPSVRRLLDFSQPMALLLVSMMHFIPDTDRPADILARLRDAVVPGSYLVLSQVGSAPVQTSEQYEAQRHYTRAAPVTLRSYDEVLAFFTGFELVEPGLVDAGQWRPEAPELAGVVDLVPMHAGVAVKP